jgi:phage terminase large subunit GpA-like protein
MRNCVQPVLTTGSDRVRTIEALREASLSFSPPPRVSVASWADANRVLDSSSPELGRWRTARTPYLRQILDDLGPDSPYERVVLAKAGQVDGTETVLNFTGDVIAHGSAACPLIQPTVEMAKRFSRQRFHSLIANTPPLGGKVKDARSRDSGVLTM